MIATCVDSRDQRRAVASVDRVPTSRTAVSSSESLQAMNPSADPGRSSLRSGADELEWHRLTNALLQRMSARLFYLPHLDRTNASVVGQRRRPGAGAAAGEAC